MNEDQLDILNQVYISSRYVLQFLETRVEKLRQMGMASRKKAQREFDEREVLKAYSSEIEGSISGKSTTTA